MQYAVTLRELDAAWKEPSARVLVESMTQDEAGEVVRIDGADAVVLAGADVEVAALVRGLLGAGLRVFSRETSAEKWERQRAAPAVEEILEEDVQFDADDAYPRIDPEFAGLIPPPDDDAVLDASLRAHGCMDALTVWAEKETLLDGHRRIKRCRALGIRFKVMEISFTTRDAARNWILENALARRSLVGEEREFVMGERMLAEKKDPSSTQFDDTGRLRQSDGAGETAVRLGKLFGVSPRSIERYAARAAAIKRIAATAGMKVRNDILRGKIKLTHVQVQRVAERGVRNEEELRAAKRGEPLPRDVAGEIAAASDRLLRLIASARIGDVGPLDPTRLSPLRTLREEIDSLLASLGGEAVARA